MTYRYDECGLDRVFLVNGYEKHDTPYGKAVSITDVAGLHRTIARAIVQSPKAITGAEFRFLRKHLDMSQKRLADLIGEKEQNVYRWEKARGKDVPGMADRLIRVITERADDTKPDEWVLERLTVLAPIEPAPISVEVENAVWKIAA